jgi:hypothetical protein
MTSAQSESPIVAIVPRPTYESKAKASKAWVNVPRGFMQKGP